MNETDRAATSAPSPPTPEMHGGEAPCFPSLWKVVVIQAQNALNDKIAQYVLLGLAQVTAALSETQRRNYAHLGALLLALPLILFAPLAGWVSDRFSKRRVLFWCSLIQLAGMVAITTAFYFDLFWVATFCFFMLASQATIISPAKGGIIKELVGERHLTFANSWTQSTGLVALVAGPWLGGVLFKWFAEDNMDEPWMAAFWPMLMLTAITTIPVFFAMRVRETPAHSSEKMRWGMLWEHFLHMGDLLRFRQLRLTSLGISFFWFSATVLALLLVQVAGAIVHAEGGDPTAVSELGGFMLLWVGLGIAAGSILVGYITPNRIELGLIPLGGLGMALGAVLAAMPFIALGSWVFNALMFVIGIASGVFLVPLNAYLQDIVIPAKRGRQLSAAALMDSLGMFFGILIQAWWAHVLPGEKGARIQLLVLSLLCLVTSFYVVRIIPQNFIRFVLLALVKLIYRVRVVHGERIPKEGGALLIANHVSYVDAFIVSAASERKIRFIAADQFHKMKWIGLFLRLFNVVPVSPRRAKDAITSVAEAIAAGDLVCIFPEGQITRHGLLNEVHKGYELIARKSRAPVVPVFMDDLWGSVFSFERGKYFKKWPKNFAHDVSVGFGNPVPYEQADTAWARRQIRELAAELILERRELRPRLEVAVTRALCTQPWRIALRGENCVTRGLLLAKGRMLAKRWQHLLAGKRIAIRATGEAGIVSSLAVRLAGFVPVHTTLPDHLLAGALRDHGIAALVTDHPAPDGCDCQIIDAQEELARIDSLRLALHVAATYVLPRSLQMWIAGRHHEALGTAREAVAWLEADASGGTRMGSFGHQEILLQSEQLSSTDAFRDGETFLPLLTDCGGLESLLVIWHAMLHGSIPIAHASRTSEAAAVVAAGPLTAEKSQALAGVESPRSLLHFSCDSARSLAEAPAWAERLGITASPCLVDAETGRILTVSMPDPILPTATAESQKGTQPGAFGRPLPGYQAESRGARLILTAPDGAEAALPGAALDEEDFVVFPGN